MTHRNAEVLEKLHAEATHLKTSPMDLQNAQRQAHRIFARKEAFRRCHKALRPRSE